MTFRRTLQSTNKPRQIKILTTCSKGGLQMPNVRNNEEELEQSKNQRQVLSFE